MFVLAVICYWPALRGEFVWDDENLVADNPYIRSPLFAGEMFRHWLQPGINSPYYRPVQTASMAVDYWFWNLNTLGYHLTNVVIHAAAAWLLFLLARQLLGRVGIQQAELISLGVAGCWLVHPIHNAAVAYISGRADPLGFLFGCAAWLLFLAASTWKRHRTLGYLASSCLMLVALCSKEIAAVWLVLFAAYTLFSPDSSLGQKIGRIGGGIAILGIWLLMRQLPVEPPLPAETVQTTIPQRVVLVTRAVADYSSMIIFPGELHMERLLWPEWLRVETNWTNLPLRMGLTGWIGVVVIVCAIAACVARGPGRKLRVGGSVWFLICFLPISNAFPLNAQAAEHWIYMGSVGALAFLAGLFLLIPTRYHRAVGAVVLLWILGLAWRTNLRAADWRDSIKFYSQTIAAMGGTPRIFNNLGTALQRRGRIEEAERVYRAALQRFPTTPSLMNNLGILLSRKGLHQEADQLFQKARTIASERSGPGDERAATKALAGRVRTLIDTGRFQEALAILKAKETQDNPWELGRLEAQSLVELGQWDEALTIVQNRTTQVWWDKDARSILARMLERRGDLQQAKQEWRMSAQLDVWDSEPWMALSRISIAQQEPYAALQYQRQAVKRSPGDIVLRLTLSAILAELGQTDAAQEEMLKARYLRAGGNL